MLTPSGGFPPRAPSGNLPAVIHSGVPAPPEGSSPFGGPIAGPGKAAGVEAKRYLTAFKHRWPLLVIFILLGVTWGFTQYAMTTKMYKTTAILQIERHRLYNLATGQKNWLEDYWNAEYFPTQYTLLMSRGMAEEVVKNLRREEEQDPSPEPRPAQLLSLLEGDIVAHAKGIRAGVSVKPIRNTQLIELTYRAPSAEWASRVANAYASAFIDWHRQTRIETATSATQYLQQQIEALREDITRKQIELSAFTKDNDFVIDPTNTLNRKRDILEKQYSKLLEQRINSETRYLRLLDRQAEDIAAHRYTGPVTSLRDRIHLLEVEYDEKLKLFRPEWPTMVEIQEKLERARRNLDELAQKAKTEELDEAYLRYQKDLAEEQAMEEHLRGFQGDTPELHAAAIEYGNLSMVIDSRRRLLNDLVKRMSETELVMQLHNYDEEPRIRIVDRAMTPRTPYEPIFERDLSQGGFAGLLLAVLLIVGLEMLDRSVKSPEELERLIRIPTLAVVPDMSDDHEGYGLRSRYKRRYFGYTDHGYFYGYGEGSGYQPAAWSKARRRLREVKPKNPEESIELLPHYNPRMGVCESYRSLRTALMLSSADELKVVAVTSAEPGEGKTVTTSNLAVVIAQLDRRVLVIDADLRRPRMHQIFGVSNRRGLVSYLTGGTEFDDLVIDTMVPNLSVCPSGPIPPNPSELLASERMRQFLEEARKRFDLILLDTPPALPVADAIMLGHATDGLIVCARAGMLQRSTARLCAERLWQGQVKLLGSVLNCYRAHPRRYYKPYQYYGVYQDTLDDEHDEHDEHDGQDAAGARDETAA